MCGIGAELFHGGSADLAPRGVDHAQEGGVVVRVHQQPQVAHDVLHLGEGEERGATGDGVGDALLAQGPLEQPRLVVAAVEDGEGHLERLVLFVGAVHHLERIAIAQLAPQLLFEHVRVLRDELVGRLEDAAHGAVVLLQLDHLEAGKVLLQQRQVFRLGAAPGVDRLVVVADHGEGAAQPDQQLHQLVLGGVGVLVFVHQQVADAVLPLLQDLRLLLEQQHRQHDEIVEIDCVERLEVAVVAGVEQGGVVVHRILGSGEGLLRGDEGVLPAGDAPLHFLFQLFIAVLLAHQFAQQRGAVGGVEDGKAGLVAECAQFLADDVQPQGVEGGDAQPFALLALEQLADTLLHLAGGLVGEGHRGDMAGSDTTALNQIGNLLRNHARLARTGAGQHQQGTVDVADGFFLSGIEVGHGAITADREGAAL